MHAPAICPVGVEVGFISQLWRHELFPGCEPMPFPYGVTCDGGACPTPCGSRQSPRTTRDTTYAYEDGKFASYKTNTTDVSGPTSYGEHCTYANGVLVTCETYRSEAFTVGRDAQGRIAKLAATGLTKTDGDISITYDEHGRVAELAHAKDGMRDTMRYDAAGRLVVEESHWPSGSPRGARITYSYDAWGRPTGSSYGRRVVRYDDHTGRVASVSEVASYGHGPVTVTTAFVYDEAGRPTTLTQTTSDGDPTHAREDRYDYVCE